MPAKKKTDTSVNPAQLDWVSRIAKRHADEIAFRAIAPWALKPGNKRILSLPADKWVWERQYLDHFPKASVHFVGLESNSTVMKRMTQDAKDQPVRKPHYLDPCYRAMSFMEYVELPHLYTAHAPFDMIYLDWMGTWGVDKMKQVDRMFANKLLAKDSMFRFTMSLNRGRPRNWKELETEITAGLHIADIRGGGSEVAEWRTHGIPSLVNDIAFRNGYNALPIALQVYYNYPKVGAPTPMGSFLFRVRRGGK